MAQYLNRVPGAGRSRHNWNHSPAVVGGCSSGTEGVRFLSPGPSAGAAAASLSPNGFFDREIIRILGSGGGGAGKLTGPGRFRNFNHNRCRARERNQPAEEEASGCGPGSPPVAATAASRSLAAGQAPRGRPTKFGTSASAPGLSTELTCIRSRMNSTGGELPGTRLFAYAQSSFRGGKRTSPPPFIER